MKACFFVLFSITLLTACQTEDTASADHSTQKPQFGQEQSTIPWNRPEQWENAGALGSVPGVGGQPGIGGPGY
jgi:outer membrane biogenesis lipoprotein LolB